MNQREAFEKWLKREYPNRTDGYIEWHEDAIEYSLDEVQFAFEAWQAAQQAQWQPIETAPRDGAAVLALIEHSDIPQSVRYINGGWKVCWDGYRIAGIDGPTHWMPLPTEPKP